jgi:hypothetical protein
MKVGDVLICKERFELFENVNIVGKKYSILNIEDNGNVYVSTDYFFANEIISGGVSTPYSLYYNNSPYSSKYIGDYFKTLLEVREEKLNELGI